MRITSLRIEKTASYDTPPSAIVGRVKLEGPTGAQEVILSAFAISQIFKVISGEIVETARANANMTKAAVSEAVNGPLLAEDSVVKIGGGL